MPTLRSAVSLTSLTIQEIIELATQTALPDSPHNSPFLPPATPLPPTTIKMSRLPDLSKFSGDSNGRTFLQNFELAMLDRDCSDDIKMARYFELCMTPDSAAA